MQMEFVHIAIANGQLNNYNTTQASIFNGWVITHCYLNTFVFHFDVFACDEVKQSSIIVSSVEDRTCDRHVTQVMTHFIMLLNV